MNKVVCFLFSLLLLSCSGGASFSRVSYETSLRMATCGNTWNGDIYNPSVGPEGFIDYRGLFLNGYLLKMERDFSYTLTYQVKDSESVLLRGIYDSSTVNSGKLVLWHEGLPIELYWATYYQLRFEWDIISPEDGTLIHTVALLHSEHIFTT